MHADFHKGIFITGRKSEISSKKDILFKLKKKKLYIEIIHFKSSTYIERFINNLDEGMIMLVSRENMV